MENVLYEMQYAMDTFYFLVCGALVMWMAAGFAMLESGLVRAKNTTEILTKNVALFAIACTMYLICGYDFMYGGGWFLSGVTTVAGMDDAAVAGVVKGVADFNAGVEDAGLQYSGASDFFFQVVFVATAMSIVSGAVAERMKLWAFLVFAVFMTGVIYPLEGGWTWGGNSVFGLYELSYSDYAGSGIVHLAGAAAALAGVLVLGPRKGKYGPNGEVNAIPGANLPLAALGMFILWMGWFGFNGGSTLQLSGVGVANEVANVFVNTNAAACGGLIAALIVARIIFGKADLTMAINGALAGLVAITAEPADPTALMSTIIGAVGGVLVVFAILFLDKLKIDDPVGAISVHGVVGIWGIFAVLISDSDATFVGQLVGMLTIFVWVFVASLVVWIAIKAIMGVRVSEEEEFDGVDLSECGMEAYPEFSGTSK
ncbi:ammonium transporter [Teredinibacter turnerae]|uniref:Ammonium transporter family protein n=1 Tax=Teredinibacter turnerae (strain ATCC 39867 / T7901) TaxID=377629 RepID=C5BUM0_TERTT|nr:ammonium transporter [Teredinibacter turnerae]ACR12560.1 ammonium transporter family protein [Teredinibacter turnerae T7901]